MIRRVVCAPKHPTPPPNPTPPPTNHQPQPKPTPPTPTPPTHPPTAPPPPPPPPTPPPPPAKAPSKKLSWGSPRAMRTEEGGGGVSLFLAKLVLDLSRSSVIERTKPDSAGKDKKKRRDMRRCEKITCDEKQNWRLPSNKTSQ